MTGNDTLSRRRLRSWIRLLRFTRATENHLREFLRVNYQTTLPRFDVAAALYRNSDPMRMSELSKQLLVSNGNATNVVDRLERDGLAVRVPSSDDRRSILVALTEEGKSWFEEMAVSHEAEINRLFANTGHDELNLLRDFLHRIEESSNDRNG